MPYPLRRRFYNRKLILNPSNSKRSIRALSDFATSGKRFNKIRLKSFRRIYFSNETETHTQTILERKAISGVPFSKKARKNLFSCCDTIFLDTTIIKDPVLVKFRISNVDFKSRQTNLN